MSIMVDSMGGESGRMRFHGHVIPRACGVVARCGGPALCRDCRFEQEMVRFHRPECQMLTPPPPGFPFETFSCNCDAPAVRAGYEQAIATLRGVAQRTGSPAARWAADYLTADPDRQAPERGVAAVTVADDGWGFTAEDESELADIVAAARLSGMIPGTVRFSRAILAAGYRRTAQPSPRWELREEFADQDVPP